MIIRNRIATVETALNPTTIRLGIDKLIASILVLLILLRNETTTAILELR